MPVRMMFGMLGDSSEGCVIAPNQHWIWNLGYAGTTAKGRVHHNCMHLFCIGLPLDHAFQCLMQLCLIFKLFRNRLTCQPASSGLCASYAASGYWKKDKYKMVSMGLSTCECASVQDYHAPKTTLRHDRPACLQLHMWALPRGKWNKVSLLQKLDVQPFTMHRSDRRWKYEVNITTPAKRLSSTITRELGSPQLANT